MSNRLIPRDQKDKKRVRDIERVFQTKDLKVYPSVPDVKQVRNNSTFIIDDGTTRYIGVRIGNEILKVQVT